MADGKRPGEALMELLRDMQDAQKATRELVLEGVSDNALAIRQTNQNLETLVGAMLQIGTMCRDLQNRVAALEAASGKIER